MRHIASVSWDVICTQSLAFCNQGKDDIISTPKLQIFQQWLSNLLYTKYKALYGFLVKCIYFN